MTRRAWLAERRRGICASDVAAILGLSPWASALSVWAEKTGAVSPDESDAEHLLWGRLLEAPIASEWARRHPPAVVELCGPRVYWHPSRPHHGATPDALVYAPDFAEPYAALEVKNVRGTRGSAWGEDGDEGDEDTLPTLYLLQAQWQHHVLGAALGIVRVYVAALIGGCELRCYSVERDQELIDVIAERVDAWWERHVVSGTPPAADGSDASASTLLTLHPHARHEEPVELGDEGARLAAEYEAAHAAAGREELRATAAKHQLCGLLGDHAAGRLPDGRLVRWTPVNGFSVWDPRRRREATQRTARAAITRTDSEAPQRRFTLQKGRTR